MFGTLPVIRQNIEKLLLGIEFINSNILPLLFMLQAGDIFYALKVTGIE